MGIWETFWVHYGTFKNGTFTYITKLSLIWSFTPFSHYKLYDWGVNYTKCK
uniref:Uncharacterized protein n=1 Tax=Anguilla anguilla TaxID=7936 RepID=A0A0E9W8L0_ANGAN